MGVIRRGILGGFSNKVANVVGSSWKGIATMKALPLSVANPRTAAQIIQRTLMTNAVGFAKQILTEIIKPLNDRFAQQMSGFNLFIQRNIDLFSTTVLQPGALPQLSRGNVTVAALTGVVSDVSLGTTVISFNDNTGEGNALADDEVYAVAWNNLRASVSCATGVTRADGSIELDIPVGTQVGDDVSIAVSMRRADGTQVSDSNWLQSNAVA